MENSIQICCMLCSSSSSDGNWCYYNTNRNLGTCLSLKKLLINKGNAGPRFKTASFAVERIFYFRKKYFFRDIFLSFEFVSSIDLCVEIYSRFNNFLYI